MDVAICTVLLRGVVSYALGALILVGIWWSASKAGVLVHTFLPTISEVIDAADTVEPSPWLQAAATSALIASGFVLGLVTGCASGMARSRYETLGRIVDPFLDMLRGIPPVMLIPFFILWFGYEPEGKITLVALNAWFVVHVGVVEQIRLLNPDILKTLMALGGSKNEYYFREAFRAALPSLLPSLRIALILSVTVALVAEFMGSTIGLGHIANVALSTFSISNVVLAAILASILSLAFDVVLIVGHALLCRWNNI